MLALARADAAAVHTNQGRLAFVAPALHAVAVPQAIRAAHVVDAAKAATLGCVGAAVVALAQAYSRE